MNNIVNIFKLTQMVGCSVFQTLNVYLIFSYYRAKIRENKLIEIVKKIKKPFFVFSMKPYYLLDNLKILKIIDYKYGNIMCKETSLVAYSLMLKSGYNPEYNVGLRKEGKFFLGHAWITSLEGIIFDTCDNAENCRTVWKWSLN